MEINYKKGSKEEFFEFVESIGLYDKVAIISHIDLDGLSSALFLEKILEAKGIKVEYMDFLDIKSDMVKELILKFTDLGIRKIFFSDLSVDSIDYEGFMELREKLDVFLIDHHPLNEKAKDLNCIIKTDSQDCSAMTLFNLGEGVIDKNEWEWLNCAAMFSDFSYKEEKNFLHIASIYPEITYENISSSIPGTNARKINSALIYYEYDLEHVYELIKERNLSEIEEVHELIEEEINRIIEDFAEKREYYLEKDLYVYEIISKFGILSTMATIISKMKPDNTFILFQRKGDTIKISARNSFGRKDMGEIMKRCIEGLEDASGGGHKMAGAARIKSKDWEIFKERLLE